MKKMMLLFTVPVISCMGLIAQTNTFPANGNVGIGTLAPAEKLTVLTPTANPGIVHTDGVVRLGTYIGSSAGYLGTSTNHPLCFRTNGSSAQAILLQSGNFGIGTPSPTERLTVRSASGVAGFAHTDGVVRLGSLLNASGALFGTLTNHPLFLRTNNGAAQVTLLQNGRVGIGTTTPLGRLDVTGGDAYIQSVRVGIGNLTNSGNTCLGAGALSTTSTTPDDYPGDLSGYDNTAIGAGALRNNFEGIFNTATGSGALYDNTMGNNNCALGYNALTNNTTGNGNTALGSLTLASFNSGFNTAVGHLALYASSGSYNTATGYRSLDSNTTGRDNTATGVYSMHGNKTGNYNTAIGRYTLYLNKTGSENTAIGDDALYYNVSGNNNTAIGFLATAVNGALSNTTALGYNSRPTASNQVRIGSSSVTSIGGYANWTNISDGRVKKNIKENVPGLNFINQLKPVTYNLTLDEADKIIKPLQVEDGKEEKAMQEPAEAKNKKEQVLYTGFVAQDVEKAAKKLNYDFSGVDAPKNENDLYGLRYAEFVVPLVKSVQELSSKNDELQKQVDELKILVAEMNKKLSGNENTGLQNVTVSSASLEQNTPNPLNNNTNIRYILPPKYFQASIVITDKAGKKIKEVNVSGSGRGSININTSALSTGTYQYSLFVNHHLVDTKQMILSR